MTSFRIKDHESSGPMGFYKKCAISNQHFLKRFLTCGSRAKIAGNCESSIPRGLNYDIYPFDFATIIYNIIFYFILLSFSYSSTFS